MNDTKTRYIRYMNLAADGDRKAAQALLRGEWWPGDPDKPADVDRVIRTAQANGYGAKP